MRRIVSAMASVTWLVAGGLSAAVAVRFSVAAVPSLAGPTETRPAPIERVDEATLPSPTAALSDSLNATRRRLERILPDAGASLSEADAGPPAPVNVPILVSHGTPRSEVYVNGNKRGLTPYIGEVSCVPGAEVRVEVLPPKGLPHASTLECQPGVLRFGPPR